MIRCVAKGNALDILKIRDKLQEFFGEKYLSVVTESIPEAVVHGAKACTAVFILDVVYFDFKFFNNFIRCEITVTRFDKKYKKPSGSRKGFWLSQESSTSFSNKKEFRCDEDSRNVIMDEYEDLELWEMRKGFKQSDY